MKKRVILASASARRKKLLEELGLEFTVIKSGVNEVFDGRRKPESIVKAIALSKAEAVAGKVSGRGEYGNSLIIGADTIVVAGPDGSFPGKVIGKPETPGAARAILKGLSGTTHYVYTGLAVLDNSSGRSVTGSEMSTVRMKELSGEEIESAAERHLDKAGAYGIQEKNDAFVTLVDGPFDNVVGLPVGKLRQLLKEFGLVI